MSQISGFRQKIITFDGIAYVIFFTLGFLWTWYLSIASDGFAVQDEIGHFLISKYAADDPLLLLNMWSRPLRSLVYYYPAMFGLEGARLFSIVLTALVVITTTSIARYAGVTNLYLIPLFMWFQPWVGELSYAVLPQIPFTLLLTFAACMQINNRNIPASIAYGLLPLTRHEGIALLFAWLVYMLYKHRWAAAVIGLLPLVVFNIVYFLIQNDYAFSIYSDVKPTERYGSGSWFHFIWPLPVDIGLPIFILAFTALPAIFDDRKIVVIFLPFILYFLLHIVIYRFGLFASGGYQLFLLPIAPAFALAAALGLEKIWLDGKQWNYRSFFPGVGRNRFLKILVIVTLLFGLTASPNKLNTEELSLLQASSWIRKNEPENRNIFSNHVAFYYFHDIRPKRITRRRLGRLPAGSILVWDSHYSERHGLQYEHLLSMSSCWTKLAAFSGNNHFYKLIGKEDTVLFKKTNKQCE